MFFPKIIENIDVRYTIYFLDVPKVYQMVTLKCEEGVSAISGGLISSRGVVFAMAVGCIQ